MERSALKNRYKVNFILIRSRIDNNNGTIYAEVRIDNKRVRGSTRIKIQAKDWSDGYPKRNQSLIIEKLRLIESKLTEHFSKDVVTEATIKRHIKNWNKKKVKNKDSIVYLDEAIDSYLEFKELDVQQNTYARIKVHLSDFKHFTPNKMLNELTPRVMERYINYLKKKGTLSNTTINTYRKNVKTFTNWLHRNDYIPRKIEIPRLREIEKEIIQLNDDEVSRLENRKNKVGQIVALNKRQDITADMFLCSCYTGLRFSDLKKLKLKNINEEGFLKIRQQKTDDMLDVYIIQKVVEILKKYSGKLPDISNQRANIYLKEVFRKLQLNRDIFINKDEEYSPLNRVISFHVGRKTFISLAARRGTPVPLIMKMSGHKDLKVVQRYINFDNQTIANEMNKLNF